MWGDLSCPASVCFDKKKEVVKRKQAVELRTELGWAGLGWWGFRASPLSATDIIVPDLRKPRARTKIRKYSFLPTRLYSFID